MLPIPLSGARWHLTVFIYVLSTLKGIWIWRNKGEYNNVTPRDQVAILEGWGKGANAAHYNTLESFPLFLAGVVAVVDGVWVRSAGETDEDWTNGLSLAYLALRVLYIVVYIVHTSERMAALRSVIFTLSLLVIVGLYIVPGAAV
eukprot:EC685691.1.p2 GENE.EC685691.1~~EC685691.1.p2  ORF type:complete len:145 (+),score=42.13 EC685691.1:67-501(+)